MKSEWQPSVEKRPIRTVDKSTFEMTDETEGRDDCIGRTPLCIYDDINFRYPLQVSPSRVIEENMSEASLDFLHPACNTLLHL